MMTLADLPHFVVDEINAPEGGENGIISGRFSDLHGVRGTRGYLYQPKGASILIDLDARPLSTSETVRGRTHDVEYARELQKGQSIVWLDGEWEPHHLSMILSPHARWDHRSFSTAPARYFDLDGVMGWQPVDLPLPPGATDLGVRPGGWDEVRCEICPEDISADHPTTEAYVDADGRWLCPHCYERFAKPRDVSFAVGG
jgi:hypothetical protein